MTRGAARSRLLSAHVRCSTRALRGRTSRRSPAPLVPPSDILRSGASLARCDQHATVSHPSSERARWQRQAILTPFIKAHNQRADVPIDLATLEGVTLDGERFEDLDAPVWTFVSAEKEKRKVVLLPPAA